MTPPRSSSRTNRPAHPRAFVGRLVGATAIAVAGALGAAADAQQRWSVQTGVAVRGTASNNVNFAPTGQEQADFILELSPHIALIGQDAGGRIRASGSFELGGGLFARALDRDQSRLRLRPARRFDATVEAIENFFFLDAGVSAQRILENPFLARPDGFQTYNTAASYQARLSPYIKGNLGGGFGYTVRSDHSWTDSSVTIGQYSSRQLALVERAPQPLGGALSVEQLRISSQRSGAPARTRDLARAIARYAPVPELAFGVRGGWERNNYLLANQGRTFYGADLMLRPTERTQIDGYWEDRFFGSSWQAGFSHRMPRLAFNLQWSRNLVTTSQQFLTFPALANLFALLDASLTTRVPDPVERQRIIIDFLSQRQLPRELLTPVVLFDDRVSLQTLGSAGAVLQGNRNSLALSVFQVRIMGLVGVNTQLPPTLADNLQRGAELTLSHNLTPSDALSATGSWRRTENLPGSAPAQTTQKLLRLQVSSKLGAWTYGFLGARYQWIDSNIANDAREVAVFAGFDYRF